MIFMGINNGLIIVVCWYHGEVHVKSLTYMIYYFSEKNNFLSYHTQLKQLQASQPLQQAIQAAEPHPQQAIQDSLLHKAMANLQQVILQDNRLLLQVQVMGQLLQDIHSRVTLSSSKVSVMCSYWIM